MGLPSGRLSREGISHGTVKREYTMSADARTAAVGRHDLRFLTVVECFVCYRLLLLVT